MFIFFWKFIQESYNIEKGVRILYLIHFDKKYNKKATDQAIHAAQYGWKNLLHGRGNM